MPKEIKIILRLLKGGQISDREAFSLLWMAFYAMSQQPVTEDCQQQPSEEPQRVEVRGFAPQE